MADTRTLHGLDGVLDALKSLPPEIVSKRGGPVANSLRKGGNVVKRAFQANIRRVVRNTVAEGYVSTKTLERAVVVRRDPNPRRVGAAERYRVRISRSKQYSNGRTNQGEPVTAAMTGYWLEHGTEHQPPEPWATPAFMESRERALKEVVDELGRGVKLAISKASRGR
jgi:HK97 gp10 family phage protein